MAAFCQQTENVGENVGKEYDVVWWTAVCNLFFRHNARTGAVTVWQYLTL